MPGHCYSDRCWCGCLAPPIAGSAEPPVSGNRRRSREAGQAELLQLPAFTCPPEGLFPVIITKLCPMPALRVCHAVTFLRERLSSTANFLTTERWRISY